MPEAYETGRLVTTANSLALLVEACQVMSPAVGEDVSRAGDRVADRRRDPRLAVVRRPRHAGGDVNTDPGDVVAEHGDLGCVDPGAGREAQAGDELTNDDRGVDRRRRSVEHGEEAVSQRLHDAAAACTRRFPGGSVQLSQHLAPRSVAEVAGVPCRPDDVEEHDRGKSSAVLGVRLPAGRVVRECSLAHDRSADPFGGAPDPNGGGALGSADPAGAVHGVLRQPCGDLGLPAFRNEADALAATCGRHGGHAALPVIRRSMHPRFSSSAPIHETVREVGPRVGEL